jgi:hypothetical protein
MPVHLGSMGESIKIVARRNAGRMRPGDVYVLNDPYHGGTHLPDVTVVTPVFGQAGAILFYVASRGHHAEIGGITPGSMPAFSTRIEEEGVLIDNWLLVRDGELREAATLDLLRGALTRPATPASTGRPACADSRQREGGRRAGPHGRPFRAGRGAGLHGARAGQRRGGGAPGDRRAARR